MCRVVLLLSLLVLAAAMTAAQAAPHSSFSPPSGTQSSAATSHSPSASGSELRKCLSGKKGDYTLTDHQGKQHRIVGDGHVLWDEVGHEVDLTGKLSSGMAFQETGVTDIASRCWNFTLN